MMSIDHEEVRKMIREDRMGYHVRTVPCLFLFFGNGRLEKYEGSDAFVWLRKVKEIEAPPPPATVTTPKVLEEQEEVVVKQLVDEEEQEVQPLPPVQDSETMMANEMNMRRAADQFIARKQDNIMSVAQMMQQQREKEDEVLNPAPPGSRMSSDRKPTVA